MGKHKQRSIMTKLYTHDGQILFPEKDVLRACCTDANDAFILDSSEQLKGPDGNWYQLLSDSSCIPMCAKHPEKFKDLWEIVKQIHHASRRAEINAQFANANKKKTQDFILKLVAIPCTITGLMYLVSRLWG